MEVSGMPLSANLDHANSVIDILCSVSSPATRGTCALTARTAAASTSTPFSASFAMAHSVFDTC
eukprot:CAMPEP_0198702940 /NCGR_PEP_ID=MMETSP1468-20131203/389054_1 /TAXON_ID=1461545 /ORGANISM="Mantoniella sp, Strain CCMP1436" /LENGTH=63 /DNA_ID=CAMNT_0044461555 /DNA_START=1433 /DNA_END=1624 /DNA_ORIENTATION=-